MLAPYFTSTVSLRGMWKCFDKPVFERAQNPGYGLSGGL